MSGSDLAVVADRERRTNFHGALRGCGLGVTCRLLREINGRLIVIRFQKGRSFFQTSATHGAGSVHVPGAGNVQRLFTVFVRHGSGCTKSKRGAQSLCEKTWSASTTHRGVAVGIALGSTSGS